MNKEELRKHFEKNWEKYYSLDFFKKEGFIRKKCIKCNKNFWTLDENRNVCGDSACVGYQFIGKKIEDISYIDAWKKISNFFKKNNHEIINRYPVVCRWFPDLYFVVASIVNFYRKQNGNIYFELPYSKLIVPQFCLRFNDLENVGITGRHYTCFVMIGQHSMPSLGGYWKEEATEIDFTLLTKEFKIPKEEITFIEDVWIGSQAFGYSLEYFVRGLELGNIVFTEFEFFDDSFREMKQKIIDMGAGLERFPWLLSGVASSYLKTFEPQIEYLKKYVEFDFNFLNEFYKIAGYFDLTEIKKEEFLEKVKKELNFENVEQKIFYHASIFKILDYLRALLFAISDGALPSNVGGGYNLRKICREIFDLFGKYNFNFDIAKILEIFANQLEIFDKTLKENVNLVFDVIENEKKKYNEHKKRAKKILEKILKNKSELSYEEAKLLYESHGITRDIILSLYPNVKVPEILVSEKKVERKEEKKVDVSNLPETKILFYDNVFEFEAKVLRIIDKYVILDKTAFYPTMGGQKHDTGFINGCKVINVFKVGNVIVHEVEKINFSENQLVKCIVDKERREILTKHHTATHIVLAACRKVLGNHVWQAGAEKDVDKARLDITHYKEISEEEIEKIEENANEIIKQNLNVDCFFIERTEAEKNFGFKIYQGGYVPEKIVRIVKIGNIDIEACSGTHVKNTSEIEIIKIINVKKIADNVYRFEFVAGKKAIEFLKEREKILDEICKFLNCNYENAFEKVKELFNEWKKKVKKKK